MSYSPIHLPKDKLEEQLLFWKNKLQDLSPLQLPTDFPRPAIQHSNYSSAGFKLEKSLLNQLISLSQQQNVNLFITLLSVFKLLLYRSSGQEDICVGTWITSREKQGTQELHGFSVNSLALRSHLQGSMSCNELLQTIHMSTLESFKNGQVPFEKVVEAVTLEKDMSKNPFYQHCFVLKDEPESELYVTEVLLPKHFYPYPTAKFDLTFQLIQTDHGIEGKVAYSTTLYRQDTIERMINHYKQLITSVIKDPLQSISTLKLITKEEEKVLIQEFGTSTIEYPRDKTVIDLFEAHAANTPEAMAVVYEDKHLTYKELNEKANQLAHYLKSKGVKGETLVPICIERSLEMIVGLLGIMKAGAVYVPIDPAYPRERINYILEDTRASIAVVSLSSQLKLKGLVGLKVVVNDETLGGQPAINLATRLLPHHLVYVIYTSGSTGKPKGAMIEHGNLMDHCYGMIESSNLQLCKSFALTSPLVFDAGHSILHSCFVLGGTLHILSEALLMNGEELTSYLKEKEVDCMKIVPSLWLSYVEQQNIALARKVMVFGGESFSTNILPLILEANYRGQVYNHYGPTETTIGKCIHRVEVTKAYTIVPIGKPFGNTQLYIIDGNFQPVPIGIPGELCIAGEGVGRGYLNHPERTAEKFIPNPFNKEAGTRIYRTGDLARWLPDGNIEYVGRGDDQVKIRGFRIELGEIESVLQQYDPLKQVVVVVRTDKEGNKRLIAFVVTQGVFDRGAAVAYLQGRLPEYMIPSQWMQIERLPLTFNGKVNKRALLEVDSSALQSKSYQSARTEEENQLIGIWQRLLKVEKVGIEDDFFDLGGHSLLAMRVITAVRKEMKKELSIRDLFSYPTIALLSSRLQVQKQSTLSELQHRKRPDLVPLSYSQQSLWFIHQLEGSVQYHIPMVVHIEGKLNEKALQMALRQIVNRHEVLRTVIIDINGKSYQKIGDIDQWHLQIIDNPNSIPSQDSLQETIIKLVQAPFDLTKDPMLRACLIRLGSNEYALVLTVHHIAFDKWSSSILKKELILLYEAHCLGKPVSLNPLPVQYADYALWQRTYLQYTLQEKLQYWKTKLQDVSPLQLPTDLPRPAVLSTRGNSIRFVIDHPLCEQLQLFCGWQKVTLFMALLTAFKVLLYRYSGQQDICVGTPVAGRERQEIEKLIGFFVNSLALRTHLQGSMSFTQVLQAVKATTLEAFEHSQVPFEKVVEAVGQERDLSCNPIFQHCFVWQNVPQASLQVADIQLSEQAYTHPTTKFDLTFQLTETVQGIEGTVEYCTNLYKKDTIKRMIGHYKELLTSVVINPLEAVGLLKILIKEEENQLVKMFNNSYIAYPNKKTVVDLIEEQAQDTPDAIAVIFEEKQLTYKELNEKANQLAHYLKKSGVKQESLVPLCIERSLEMIIGILGILKAGGAYVPIDPTYPQERIKYVLEDTNASMVICNSESKALFESKEEVLIIDLDSDWMEIFQESEKNLDNHPAYHHLAYIIYTSGSTGQPKGVLIEHRGLASSTQARQFYYKKINSILLIPSFAFDSSVAVIFGSLSTGGKLVLCRSEWVKDVVQLKSLLKETEAILCVPSYYRFLLEEKVVTDSSLKKVIVAGENLEESLMERHFTIVPHIDLYNEYGPTECTVWASVAKIEQNSQKVTIGKPIENSSIYILSKDGQLNPIGIPGELCIGGEGVGRGYLNRPQLTEEKFVANPFSPDKQAKMYRTGDLARWLPDGNIEYAGRIDEQVKIRGFRIEPGEIESVLKGHQQIRQAAVVARADKAGNTRLVAFVVAEDVFDREAAVSYLKLKLPEHMVPRLWVEMEHLPLNSNGKVNKKALPEVDPAIMPARHYEAPQTTVEERLASIWQQVLGVEQVGRYDDFFELGGNSLMAMRVYMEVKRTLGSILPLSAVFAYPKLVNFAIQLQTVSDNDTWDPLVTIQPKGSLTPIYFVHDAFGDIEYAYRLATFLGEQHPIYGLLGVGTNGIDTPLNSMAALMDFHIKRLLTHQPEGPYHLISFSLGGNLVHALACRLAEMGKKVGLVVIFDAYPINHSRFSYRRIALSYVLRSVANFFLAKDISFAYKCKIISTEVPELIRFNLFRIKSRLGEEKKKRRQPKSLEPREKIYLSLKQATDNYKVQPFPGQMIFFRAKENTAKYLLNSDFGWKYYAKGGIQVYDLPGIHRSLLREKSTIEYVATTLNTHFDWFEQIHS